MRYLFEKGRFKLYEVEGQDKQTPGTTGTHYSQDTILLFEAAESEAAIGREVAWAENEREAMNLADDITSGVQNISIDVQVNLAEKIVEDRGKLLKEPHRKAGQAQTHSSSQAQGSDAGDTPNSKQNA